MNPIDVLLSNLKNHWEDTFTLKRNDYLVHKDTISTNLYLVEEGSLRVFIEDETVHIVHSFVNLQEISL